VIIRWTRSRGAELVRSDYSAEVLDGGLVLAGLEVRRTAGREWIARVVEADGHAFPWLPSHRRLADAKESAIRALECASRRRAAGVCPHGGTFTGACRPRIADGRCIWCERALPVASPPGVAGAERWEWVEPDPNRGPS
jgi:hypothetical protein